MPWRIAPWLAVALVVSFAAPCAAQDAGLAPAQSLPRSPAFLATYDFHLQAIHLRADDEQFVWDADFGGDIDLVDYGKGRLNFLANYEAVIGDELRAFDVNQSNYTLDLRASVRGAQQEVAAVFNHVSRHISDRPRPFPIDWNMLGVQYWRTDDVDSATLRSTTSVLYVISRSFVDYTAQLGGQATLEVPMATHATALAGGAFTMMAVNRELLNRDRQWGGRAEGGVRIFGDAGMLDLVLGYERRIDAHPLQIQPRHWMYLGFRFLTR
jgi:hypothetical protein